MTCDAGSRRTPVNRTDFGLVFLPACSSASGSSVRANPSSLGAKNVEREEPRRQVPPQAARHGASSISTGRTVAEQEGAGDQPTIDGRTIMLACLAAVARTGAPGGSSGSTFSRRGSSGSPGQRSRKPRSSWKGRRDRSRPLRASGATPAHRSWRSLFGTRARPGPAAGERDRSGRDALFLPYELEHLLARSGFRDIQIFRRASTAALSTTLR